MEVARLLGSGVLFSRTPEAVRVLAGVLSPTEPVIGEGQRREAAVSQTADRPASGRADTMGSAEAEMAGGRPRSLGCASLRS